MGRVILVRHAESEANRDHTSLGRADSPLTDHGRVQVRALAQALAGEPITRVLTSPLSRAADAADAIAAHHTIPAERHEALLEMDVGDMEGLPWDKPAAYRQGSPLWDLSKVTTPTVIHMGENDERVPLAHAQTLYRGLHVYLGVDAELLVYPGAGHGLTTYKHRNAKLLWDIAWFDHYLGVAPSEDGPKPD